MKTSDAIEHFGTKAAIASALRLQRAAVTQWGDEVPARRAYELERITGGKLKADTGIEALNANSSAETGCQNVTPATKQGAGQ